MNSHEEFKAFYKARRLRLRRDEDGFPILVSNRSRWSGYEFGWERAGWLNMRTFVDGILRAAKTAWKKLEAVSPRARILQMGDDGINAEFPAGDLMAVVDVFGLRKRTVTYGGADREHMIRIRRLRGPTGRVPAPESTQTENR